VWTAPRTGNISIRNVFTGEVEDTVEVGDYLIWCLTVVGKQVWCGTEMGPILVYDGKYGLSATNNNNNNMIIIMIIIIILRLTLWVYVVSFPHEEQESWFKRLGNMLEAFTASQLTRWTVLAVVASVGLTTLR
jgi:hypothetical protein